MGSTRRASASGRMSKDKVKEVQSALKSKGMDPGPEDGVLGPKTQQAIREFQKSNNLQATGRIDDKTASALGVDVASSGAGSSSSSGIGSSSSPGTGSASSGMGSSSSGAAGSGSSSGSKASPSSKGSSSSVGSGSDAGTSTPSGTGQRSGSSPTGSPAGKTESGEGNPK